MEAPAAASGVATARDRPEGLGGQSHRGYMGLYRGFIGIMENEMETTIEGLAFKGLGVQGV